MDNLEMDYSIISHEDVANAKASYKEVEKYIDALSKKLNKLKKDMSEKIKIGTEVDPSDKKNIDELAKTLKELNNIKTLLGGNRGLLGNPEEIRNVLKTLDLSNKSINSLINSAKILGQLLAGTGVAFNDNDTINVNKTSNVDKYRGTSIEDTLNRSNEIKLFNAELDKLVKKVPEAEEVVKKLKSEFIKYSVLKGDKSSRDSFENDFVSELSRLRELANEKDKEAEKQKEINSLYEKATVIVNKLKSYQSTESAGKKLNKLFETGDLEGLGNFNEKYSKKLDDAEKQAKEYREALLDIVNTMRDMEKGTGIKFNTKDMGEFERIAKEGTISQMKEQLDNAIKSVNSLSDAMINKLGTQAKSEKLEDLKDDFEDISNATRNIKLDGSLAESLKKAGDAAGKTADKIELSKKATNNVKNAFSNFKQSVNGLRSSLLDLIAVYGLFSTLKNIGSAIVERAKEIETSSVTIVAMAGNLEKASKIISNIQTLSQNTPYSYDSLSKSATMMLSYGVAIDNVNDRLNQLSKVSKGDSEQLLGISKAYGQVTSKQKVYAEELNQMAERGLGIKDAMQDVLGVTSSELMKMMKQGELGVDVLDKALDTLTGKGGKFYKVLDEVSNTVDGLESKVKNQSLMLGADIAAPALREYKMLLNDILGEIENFRNNNANVIRTQQELKKITREVTNAVRDIAKSLGENTDNIIGFLKAISSIVKLFIEHPYLGISIVIGPKILSLVIAIGQLILSMQQLGAASLNYAAMQAIATGNLDAFVAATNKATVSTTALKGALAKLAPYIGKAIPFILAVPAAVAFTNKQRENLDPAYDANIDALKSASYINNSKDKDTDKYELKNKAKELQRNAEDFNVALDAYNKANIKGFKWYDMLRASDNEASKVATDAIEASKENMIRILAISATSISDEVKELDKINKKQIELNKKRDEMLKAGKSEFSPEVTAIDKAIDNANNMATEYEKKLETLKSDYQLQKETLLELNEDGKTTLERLVDGSNENRQALIALFSTEEDMLRKLLGEDVVDAIIEGKLSIEQALKDVAGIDIEINPTIKVGAADVDTDNLIESLNKTFNDRDLLTTFADLSYKDFSDTIKNERGSIEEYITSLNNTRDDINSMINEIIDGGYTKEDLEARFGGNEDLQNILSKITGNRLEDIKLVGNALRGNTSSLEDQKKELEDINDKLVEYKKINGSALTDEEAKNLNEALDETKERLREINNVLESGLNDALKERAEDIQNMLSSLSSGSTILDIKVDNDSISTVIDTLNKLGIAYGDVIDDGVRAALIVERALADTVALSTDQINNLALRFNSFAAAAGGDMSKFTSLVAGAIADMVKSTNSNLSDSSLFTISQVIYQAMQGFNSYQTAVTRVTSNIDSNMKKYNKMKTEMEQARDLEQLSDNEEIKRLNEILIQARKIRDAEDRQAAIVETRVAIREKERDIIRQQIEGINKLKSVEEDLISTQRSHSEAWINLNTYRQSIDDLEQLQALDRIYNRESTSLVTRRKMLEKQISDLKKDTTLQVVEREELLNQYEQERLDLTREQWELDKDLAKRKADIYKESMMKVLNDTYDEEMRKLDDISNAKNKQRSEETYKEKEDDLLDKIAKFENATEVVSLREKAKYEEEYKQLQKERQRELEDQAIDDRRNELQKNKEEQSKSIENTAFIIGQSLGNTMSDTISTGLEEVISGIKSSSIDMTDVFKKYVTNNLGADIVTAITGPLKEAMKALVDKVNSSIVNNDNRNITINNNSNTTNTSNSNSNGGINILEPFGR